MENPEEYRRGLFEESFRKAFEGKEATPPASVWEKLAWKKSFVGKEKGVNPPSAVWSRIQNELYPAAAKIPFYKSNYAKMAAAAAVLFFVVIFGLNNVEFAPSEIDISQNEEINVSENINSQSSETSTSDNRIQNQREGGSIGEQNSTTDQANNSSANQLPLAQSDVNSESSQAVNIKVNEQIESIQIAALNENNVFDIDKKIDELSEILLTKSIDSESFKKSSLEAINQGLDVISLDNSTSTKQIPNITANKKTPAEITTFKVPETSALRIHNPNKGFFTQMSFNTGSFDPNFTMQEVDIINAYALTVNSRESVAVPAQMGVQQKSESSMQIGVGLGYKLGKNLLIESGIQYANHTTTSISNVVSTPQHFTWGKPVTVAVTNEERLRPQMEFEITDAYLIRNAFQFVSIPLNFGFIIPINKTEVLLKTGATANVFTGGEIIDPNGRLLTEVFKPGNASPYNAVFVQGMVATEVAYKISPAYSLGVQAGYFFAVSDLAKSNVLFSSQPNQYNLGFVMRYNLPRF